MTEILETIPVEIKNWASIPAKPRLVVRTTTITLVVDGGVAGFLNHQIASYEPNRVRLVVQAIDGPIALLTERPTSSPDTNTAATPCQGRHIPQSADKDHEFFGPDEFWVNSLVGSPTTRVTVTKEFCE